MQGLANFNLNLSVILSELKKRLKVGEDLRDKLMSQSHFTYENLVLPLAAFHHELHIFWSPLSHLNAVKNTPELRKVYDAGVVLFTEYQVKLAQDERLYAAYKALQDVKDFNSWPEARRRVIDYAIRDFKLSGVALPAAKKKQYKELQTKLSECTTQFEHHLMDAIDAWSYHTEKQDELEGIPEVVLAASVEKAKAKGRTGYLFGIDAPTYIAVMSHAKNPELRKHFYRAYVTRASELGDIKFDNSKLMVEILKLKQQEAQLLEFKNYAQVSLATKMAKTEERVLSFLRDLAVRTKKKALAELEEIKTFALQMTADSGQKTELAVYDIPYYSERMKEVRFGFSDEELRQYFPLSKVLNGLFGLLQQIFGISFVKKDAPSWDSAVQFFEVYDEHKNLRGGIYMDLFARAQKRSGAWMDDARGRFFAEGIHDHPIAYLTCNFMQGDAKQESYLLHDDIVTLFHEMGHVLQHVLTQVNEPDVAGISGIPWDAVELPSQFLENFAWQKEVLKQFGLPDDLIQKLRETQTFQGALQMLRQIEFALFDFLLHQRLPPKTAEEIQALLDEVRQEAAVVIPPEFNRFQHSFSHIFAGGYSAGYYSYKWAEVLSADAFSRFEEEGLFNRGIGEIFRKTILESGGARDALELFVEFRGREPKVDALLRASGIV